MGGEREGRGGERERGGERGRGREETNQSSRKTSLKHYERTKRDDSKRVADRK